MNDSGFPVAAIDAGFSIDVRDRGCNIHTLSCAVMQSHTIAHILKPSETLQVSVKIGESRKISQIYGYGILSPFF